MKSKALLVAILILAAVFRLYGINWDSGHKFHPDERAIIMNVTNPDFHWPKAGEWQLILTPDSPLNPHWFPYGSFPLYLLKFTSHLASYIDPELAQYSKIHLVGRSISVFFDLATVVVIYLITRYLFQKTLPAFLASFLYATAVLPIQLSHFYAVDILLTFFITLTLYLCLLNFNHKNLLVAIILGVLAGLSFSTKASSLPILVPVLLSFVPQLKHFSKMFWKVLLCSLAMVATFTITMPYAFIDYPTFSRQLKEQSAMTRDAWTFPYTLQFVGNTPYLYQLKNIYLWGLGPILATTAFIGLLYFTYQAFKSKSFSMFILLSYFYIFFGIVGGFAVGFIRYLIPIYPLLCIFAAFLISSLRKKPLTIAFCLLIMVWPLSFMHIYTQSNPRVTATEWMNANIPPNTIVAREHWDDGLPLYGRHDLNPELPMYEPDTPQKWAKINAILNSVDYYVIASNRLYAPLMRLTDCEKLKPKPCFTKTAQFYTDLFTGKHEFKKIAEFSLYPTIPILNIPIIDTSADEVFTVYDHPKVMIFKKQ